MTPITITKNKENLSFILLLGGVLLVCLTLLYSRSSLAFVELAPTNTKTSLGASFEYLEDRTNTLTLQRLLKDHQALPWQQSDTPLLSFGFSESSYWFHTLIRNSSDITLTRWLELVNPNLNRIDLYYRAKGEAEFKHESLGTDQPYQARMIDHPNFVIPLSFPASTSLEIYLRVQTTSVSMMVDSALWEPTRFIEESRNDMVLQGIYFGVIGIMLLYNFFIFVVSRDKSYLYYCAFSLCAGLMVASYNGYTFAYLWPEATTWQHFSTLCCGSLATVFACLFVRHFLQLFRYHSILDGVIKYLGILSFVETLVIPLFSFKFVFFLLALTSVPIYSLFMYAGLKVWQRGDRSAIYFGLPWVILILSVTLFVLTAYDIITSAWFNRYGIATATSLALVCLSLALAKRINQMRENATSTNRELREQQLKARLTQEKLLQVERKAKEDLELKVMERTRELNRALNQLSDTHARLQLMSTQDSLTGLKNRRFFDSALQNEWARAIKNKGLLSLLVLDVDYFKNINDNHGHQTGDEVLIEIAGIFSQELQNSADVVARFGGEEFIILLPQCNLHAAVALAERLRLAVQQLEIRTDRGLCRPTISIGVASLLPTIDASPTHFVAQADAALYEAKKSGRNRVCIANTLPPLAEASSKL